MSDALCESFLEVDEVTEALDADEQPFGIWLGCSTCEWVRNMGTRTTIEALGEAWRIHKAEVELRDE